MLRSGIRSYAKINLTLDILEKRPDGYHEIEMIMHPVDLYDQLAIQVSAPETGSRRTVLTSNSPHMPLDHQNLAYKAVELLREMYDFNHDVTIHIEKNIPIAAGLAGGSTNGAAVLRLLPEMLELDMTQSARMALGKHIGADVPFCIFGKPALARGIGEKLTAIPGASQLWAVLSKPNIGVSTQYVYSQFRFENVTKRPRTAAMLRAMERKDFEGIQDALANVLESVTLVHYPIVQQVKNDFRQCGAQNPLMSGSGPTVFALFQSQERATEVYNSMAKKYAQTHCVKLYGGGDIF